MTRTPGPRRLAIITWRGRAHFIDERLREFRTVAYPPDVIRFVPFASRQGGRMLRELSVAAGTDHDA